jgi:hypothetical protein
MLQRVQMMAEVLISSAQHVDATTDIQRTVSLLAAEPGLRQIQLMVGPDPHIIAASRYDWIGMKLSEIPDQDLAKKFREAFASPALEETNFFHNDLKEFEYLQSFRIDQHGQTQNPVNRAVLILRLSTHDELAGARESALYVILGSVAGLSLFLLLICCDIISWLP